jgi:flavin-dependent dehydrogenase
MRPIEIVGGGVGGLCLGIALRSNGVPTTIHEASTYPKHKVCGEFIAGVTDGTLKTLGVEQLFAPYERLKNTTWMAGAKNQVRFELPRGAIAISRYRMDKLLADEFERLGGALITQSRIPFNSEERKQGRVWATGKPMQWKKDQWMA